MSLTTCERLHNRYLLEAIEVKILQHIKCIESLAGNHVRPILYIQATDIYRVGIHTSIQRDIILNVNIKIIQSLKEKQIMLIGQNRFNWDNSYIGYLIDFNTTKIILHTGYNKTTIVYK